MEIDGQGHIGKETKLEPDIKKTQNVVSGKWQESDFLDNEGPCDYHNDKLIIYFNLVTITSAAYLLVL